MKLTNTQTENPIHSNYELGANTNRQIWNKKRRYFFLTQYKFI